MSKTFSPTDHFWPSVVTERQSNLNRLTAEEAVLQPDNCNCLTCKQNLWGCVFLNIGHLDFLSGYTYSYSSFIILDFVFFLLIWSNAPVIEMSIFSICCKCLCFWCYLFDYGLLSCAEILILTWAKLTFFFNLMYVLGLFKIALFALRLWSYSMYF